ncbi:DUF1542 domain-containing protein [Corynebacterium testudinoris]|uniref:DUF1542 domain-containing protein n=1 Tax=Corynebacterium testudinoris TaxID=136857 RepID=UPI001C8CE984|nr:DUF1542 domain-containing protein [Corynebacterium testudinoris]MBX8996666.1 DUF1542 domain-containing protein [Corynebacterium testudinoris]
METLLILAIIGGGLYYLSTRSTKQKTAEIETAQLEDAQTDARRWIERLGSQVLTIAGNDTASTQAIADASERYNAAASAISTATTVRQAQLARESALEGLHYMNAAREIMGMTPGPELPLLEGQRNAGKVTERRTIEQDGQVLTASPVATDETPNYYPGGNVAGRPVPAGWYSRPWWADAMATGMWTAASMMMFSAMFSGMAGVNYGANEFASGAGDGTEAADMGDMGDAGDMGDMGDMGGGDFGGGDAGGGFFDGGFDFDF